MLVYEGVISISVNLTYVYLNVHELVNINVCLLYIHAL